MAKRNFRDKYISKQRDLSAKSVKPPFPKIVKIDVCNICNYRCVFCPQAKQENKVGCIDRELCYQIIKDSYAAGARELCLSMTGEPLLNQDLEGYIAYAKKLGYTYIFFNTNGYLLTKERSRSLLEAGIDSVKVSVNAAGKYALIHGMDAFERVVANIKNFDALRHDFSLGGGNCVLYVSFVAVKPTLDDAEDVKRILSPYVDEIVVMNANSRGGSVCDNMSELYVADDEYSFTFPCSQIFNNVYVTAEGYMIICCQDFENLTVVADLHEESIISAWTNEKFTHFRERYLRHDLQGTLCQNCLNGTTEEVIPLTAEKSGYEVSRQKKADMLSRIQRLIADNTAP